MRILIIFNSAFQTISGMQTILEYFSQDQVDALITDRLADYNKLSNRIAKAGCFDHVYTMKTKDRKWQNWQHTWLGVYYDNEIKQDANFINNGYDVFLFANATGVSTCIATYLHKKYKTKLFMFEDGFASYSDHYKQHIYAAYENAGLSSKLFFNMERRALSYVERYYVFNPELIDNWDFNFEVLPIPKIEINSKTREILNNIYEYDNLTDNYQKKLVFFEESYFEDKIEVGDYELISKIAETIGKENIIIKIHPRNSVNRFKNAGFMTNTDTSIPWEVIALNQDFSNTYLMTISSGSSITSYFVSSNRARKSFLLYDMEEIDKSKLTPSLMVFDKICRNNPYFVYPQSQDQLIKFLKEIKN